MMAAESPLLLSTQALPKALQSCKAKVAAEAQHFEEDVQLPQDAEGWLGCEVVSAMRRTKINTSRLIII